MVFLRPIWPLAAFSSPSSVGPARSVSSAFVSATQIQERFRRHCEAEGKPDHESPPLFGPDYNGPPLGIAERISAYRERQIQLEKAAAAQKQEK
jgi:hypothetical protein